MIPKSPGSLPFGASWATASSRDQPPHPEAKRRPALWESLRKGLDSKGPVSFRSPHARIDPPTERGLRPSARQAAWDQASMTREVLRQEAGLPRRSAARGVSRLRPAVTRLEPVALGMRLVRQDIPVLQSLGHAVPVHLQLGKRRGHVPASLQTTSDTSSSVCIAVSSAVRHQVERQVGKSTGERSGGAQALFQVDVRRHAVYLARPAS